eukprot:2087402-Rhodomonas_salina.1
MDELCDTWDAWSLLQEDKLLQKIAVDACLGSSLGIVLKGTTMNGHFGGDQGEEAGDQPTLFG